jgi:hypothetical protein
VSATKGDAAAVAPQLTWTEVVNAEAVAVTSLLAGTVELLVVQALTTRHPNTINRFNMRVP